MKNNTKEMDKLKAQLNTLQKEVKLKDNLLIQLEKLSTIGQFVKEITHELKNPLSAISSYTELAIMAPTIEAKMKYLKKIPNNINTITQRLSQFRTMTFNTSSEVKNFDLNKNLAESLSTLEILKPKGTNIISSFYKNHLMVFGDSEQWNQVFLSVGRLFLNQMNANNPDLLIVTEIFPSDKILTLQNEDMIHCLSKTDWINALTITHNWVKIKFENDKIKIDHQLLKSAFSINFNYHNNADNSYLGLMIASDIVKRHGGNIVALFPKRKGLSIEIFSPAEIG